MAYRPLKRIISERELADVAREGASARARNRRVFRAVRMPGITASGGRDSRPRRALGVGARRQGRFPHRRKNLHDESTETNPRT